MKRISIENTKATQIRIDGITYNIPYRFNAAIDFKDVLAFHCYHKLIDGSEEQIKHDNDGGFSLFIFHKKSKELLWEYAQVETISIEIPEEKKPEDFITSEHYKKYMEKYGGKELITVYTREFRFRIDANTGEIYDKNESRYRHSTLNHKLS